MVEVFDLVHQLEALIFQLQRNGKSGVLLNLYVILVHALPDLLQRGHDLRVGLYALVVGAVQVVVELVEGHLDQRGLALKLLAAVVDELGFLGVGLRHLGANLVDLLLDDVDAHHDLFVDFDFVVLDVVEQELDVVHGDFVLVDELAGLADAFAELHVGFNEVVDVLVDGDVDGLVDVAPVAF